MVEYWGGGGAHCPVLYVNEPKKKGTSSARARSWASKY